MVRLQWSLSIFYFKKRGDTPIWDYEENVVEEVFRKYGINAWTGEQLQKVS